MHCPTLLVHLLLAVTSIFGRQHTQPAEMDMTEVELIASRAAELGGATLGIGLVRYATGERLVTGETGQMSCGEGSLALALCAWDRVSSDGLADRSGDVDSLVRSACRGDAGSAAALYRWLGGQRLNSWLAEKGLEETGASVSESDTGELAANSTVSDQLELLALLNRNLDFPEFRRLIRHTFPSGPYRMANLPAGITAFGAVSVTGGGESIAAVLCLPEGERFGLVVLVEAPCCAGKGELALTMVWDALQRQLSAERSPG